jgi:hypothetical protein
LACFLVRDACPHALVDEGPRDYRHLVDGR